MASTILEDVEQGHGPFKLMSLALETRQQIYGYLLTDAQEFRDKKHHCCICPKAPSKSEGIHDQALHPILCGCAQTITCECSILVNGLQLLAVSKQVFAEVIPLIRSLFELRVYVPVRQTYELAGVHAEASFYKTVAIIPPSARHEIRKLVLVVDDIDDACEDGSMECRSVIEIYSGLVSKTLPGIQNLRLHVDVNKGHYSDLDHLAAIATLPHLRKVTLDIHNVRAFAWKDDADKYCDRLMVVVQSKAKDMGKSVECTKMK